MLSQHLVEQVADGVGLVDNDDFALQRGQ
jgi:hypothetical protein